MISHAEHLIRPQPPSDTKHSRHISTYKLIKIEREILRSFVLVCYHLLLGRYSPDGQNPKCTHCPRGFTTAGTGAKSVDECTGKKICISSVIIYILKYQKMFVSTIIIYILKYQKMFISTISIYILKYQKMSGECVPCPKGTYNTKPYSTSCIPCPEGTTTFLEGANAAYICQGRKTTVL